MSDTTKEKLDIADTINLDDAIDPDLAKKKAVEKKKNLLKKRMKQGLLAIPVLLVGYTYYWMNTPYYGSMAYGVCKTFLQLYVRFPQYLRLSTVEEFETSVRIWFMQIDGFGEHRLEPMQCYFKADEALGMVLDKVTIARREIDPKMVEDFNRSLPVLLSNPPDLALPWALPDSLEGLQFQTDQLRKPIL